VEFDDAYETGPALSQTPKGTVLLALALNHHAMEYATFS
jgi:hypothetical protein